LFIHYGPARDYWFVWWGFQVLITTPVTWLLYQSRRDNLLQLKNTQKALANSKADLQFLRSQINPHFLFNALNTLYGTALLEQSPKTAEGIQKLGDMMRFMLHDNHLDFIPMSQEVAYLKNYISLFKLRIQTSDNIRITEQIEECNSGQLIGPMLLIPFVENAFKHGISQTEKSWIDIRLNYDEKEIRLEVRNSLHPDKAEDLEKGKSGIGLQNVSERLRLFYSDRHKMHCEAKNGEFVAVLLLKNK
jgi:sensor histidine kinase YesM